MQAAALLGTGVWLRGVCANVELPRVRRAKNADNVFRLTVRVLAAAVPTLDAPGVFQRERPCLEVTLGDAAKKTELAKYVAGADPVAGAAGLACPWRFDDSFAFALTARDILGPGLRFKLLGYCEVTLGLFEIEMAGAKEFGEVSIDMRRRVLPACIVEKCLDPDGADHFDGAAGHRLWETPVLVIPLLAEATTGSSGAATATITVTFSVNTDPVALLRQADFVENPIAPLSPLFEQGGECFVRARRAINDAASGCGCSSDRCRRGEPGAQQLTVRGHQPAIGTPRADLAASAIITTPAAAAVVQTTPAELKSPRSMMHFGAAVPLATTSQSLVTTDGVAPIGFEEEAEDGWVSQVSPSGRTMWHHLSLGPPPWQAQPKGLTSTRSLSPPPDDDDDIPEEHEKAGSEAAGQHSLIRPHRADLAEAWR